MRILVMDTTGPACSVALRVPGQGDLCVSEDMARGQAERLAPMVQEALAEAGLAPNDIDRIGVTTGPGSFAGSRVGVAFARGLSLATGAECVGISNLEWWAKGADTETTGMVLSVHDAKRGELVRQLFRAGMPMDEPVTQSIEETKTWLMDLLDNSGPVYGMQMRGSGAALLLEVNDSWSEAPAQLDTLLDLAEAAQPPFDRPKPFYARPPDAKLPGGKTPE